PSKRTKAVAIDVALPSNFRPSNHSVIVGKSKISKTAQGNARLKTLAQIHLDEYSKADTKAAKSKIVSKIVKLVQSKCPLGAFVKHSKEGLWYEVPQSVAREKVGYCFRDLLHGKYKSSSASKAAKRRLSKLGTESGKQLPQDEQPQQQHRRVSVVGPEPPQSSSTMHESTGGQEQSLNVEESASISDVIKPRASPMLSITKSVSYVEPIECGSTPTLLTSNDDADSGYISDLEPLPFDGNEEEHLVECGDIILADDDNHDGCIENENMAYPEQESTMVFPTYTSSAMALMTTMKSRNSLVSPLNFSGVAARSSAPFLRQPYKMATPPMNWMSDIQACISATNGRAHQGPLGLSNFIQEQYP
ncbi:MAG: hypothetical protein SGILL_008671, partial [Bacillariaceae sp.]